MDDKHKKFFGILLLATVSSLAAAGIMYYFTGAFPFYGAAVGALGYQLYVQICQQ